MRRLLLAPALALVLTACAGGDPVQERREAVADVTDAANAGDPTGLRDAVEDLLSVLRRQVASGEVDRAEAERLQALAQRIAASADLVAPAQEPSPVPTVEEPSPEPTEEEEPSPEPTEEEEPSPEPTEEPEEEEPSPEPVEEEPLPEVTVPPTQPSPTPAQVTQPAPQSPSPQPTA